MQRILSAIGQAFRKSILILIPVAFIALSGLFIFVEQPSSLAAPISIEGQKLLQQDKMSRQSEDANLRNQDYEEQIKAAEDPDKVYEENLKEFNRENPGEGIVQKAVEGTKDLVNKVTGNE